MTAGPLMLTVFVSYVGECPCFQEALGLMGTRLAGGGGQAGRLALCLEKSLLLSNLVPSSLPASLADGEKPYSGLIPFLHTLSPT